MRKIFAILSVVMALVLCGCTSTQTNTNGDSTAGGDAGATAQASDATQADIAHRYATSSEGKKLLLSNEEYYAGFSQNDLDFRMQKAGATMEEYKAFAAGQVLDFTDEEKVLIDEQLAQMADTLDKNEYVLPPLDEIVFVKTTMAEECDAGAYTHATTVYLSASLLDYGVNMAKDGVDTSMLTEILWHELFHCLTRSDLEFKSDMYGLIHFAIHDSDFAIPPSVEEYHISNPDVKQHDSSAVFSIDGSDVECFCDYVTTRHFEKEGDSFFELGTTALVPVDGSDVYYTPELASNFDEIFGQNTDYVIDPEECMADNFCLALTYGTAGVDGEGYKSPEIIEGILAYLSR